MPDSLGPHPDSSTAASTTTRRRLRVALADDHEGVRAGLRDAVSDHATLEVVGEARDGLEAVALAHALRPDVIVMDIVMPRLDGVAATRRIRAELPQVVVLGLSTDDVSGRHPIERAGAAAYFSKSDGARALIAHLLAMSATLSSTDPHST